MSFTEKDSARLKFHGHIIRTIIMLVNIYVLLFEAIEECDAIGMFH